MYLQKATNFQHSQKMHADDDDVLDSEETDISEYKKKKLYTKRDLTIFGHYGWWF
jgi:hypothetical protein